MKLQWLASSMIAICTVLSAPTHINASTDESGDLHALQDSPPNAQDRLRAFEEEWAGDITPQNNAISFFKVYFRPHEFRDEAYAENLIELGIVLPADEVPHYMEWFNYYYEVLDNDRESREQMTLLRNSTTLDPQSIPAVIAWLDLVGPALDAMRDATALPYLWMPYHEPDQPEHSFLRHAMDYRRAVIPIQGLIEAYLIRAQYFIVISEDESALADLIAADQLNKLLRQFMNLDVLEEYSRESGKLNKVLVQLLATHRLSEEQLARLDEQWRQSHRGFTSLQVINQWERLWLIDYFERVASGAEEEPSFLLNRLSMGGPVDDSELEGWDWMVTHEMFDTEYAIERINSRYDWLIQQHVESDFASTQERLSEANSSLRTRMGHHNWDTVDNIYEEQVIPDHLDSASYTNRIVNYMLVFLMHPNRVLDGPMDKFESDLDQIEGVTAIALTRYRLKHQAYPDALADLVPDFLEEIPTDLYNSGEPLKYSRSGNRQSCRILSVGTDQEDNQGEGYNDIYMDLD